MVAPLDVATLEKYVVPIARDDVDPRDAILYALGVGAGLSSDLDETDFLFERDLQILPTMALVLGTPGFWAMAPQSGLDWINILHGEQRLKLFEPLEPGIVLEGQTRVTALADKGPGKPALIQATKELRTLSGLMVARSSEVWVVRGAGGFGGDRVLAEDPLPPVPERDPDFEIDLPTSLAQAAIYRLSGDRNPLHIDAATASQAGYDRPILHGLCTMGLAARALIHTCCNGVASRLHEISVRFTGPVFPGDTIRTHVWQNGRDLHFRCDAIERGVRVIDHGVAAIAAPDTP